MPTSLLHWIKRLIACHKRYPVFGHLTLNVLHPANQAVLAYLRSSPAETIFVVNNLSRFVQPVELDLSTYEGAVPIEIIGHTRFPPIGPQSYFLSLGPHGFYWFRLDRAEPPLGTHRRRKSTGARLPKAALPLNRSHHITLPDVGFSVLFEFAVERLAIYAKKVCGFLLFAFGEL
jgi:maltose alpha-D-glucosyltransferase/alpha-amylase